MNQKTYNLNKGQEEAAEAFLKFLLTDTKEFIISGSAGVGKTYLMNYIIDTTLAQYKELCQLVGIPVKYNEVIMTATNNKAAEVLSQMTSRPTSTIHSFLGLRVFDDYTSGRSKITKTNSWMVHSNKIIFIDECSMIDSDLYKILHEGTFDCKIVYVGDHNQLAPVMEPISPVYKQPVPFYELTEQMRNSTQPALMTVCQQLRQTVATGQFNPIEIIPGVIDHLDDNQMQSEIIQHFMNQNEDSRILAYTNKQVNDYNQYIRDLRKLPDSFITGENLIINNAFKKHKETIPVETGIKILKNLGPTQQSLGVFEGEEVLLDVDILTIETTLGKIFNNVYYPTDREHFNALIKYFKNRSNWKMYYSLKQDYPDLRARDAATVHKAQGSTYNTVFIDLGNISTCRNIDQAARMLYVAFSRAKSRIYLYGQLVDKFGGLKF